MSYETPMINHLNNNRQLVADKTTHLAGQTSSRHRGDIR